MYGFEAASRICTTISEAAKISDLDRARILVGDLRAHLTSLEIRYV